MNAKGYLYIFGSLAVVVALIAGGIYLQNGYGAAMVVIGAVGVVAWLMGMFNLIGAMNSDI